MRYVTPSNALQRKGNRCRKSMFCPTSRYISQSLLFHFFCSHALAIALINYISLVALETEVRKCIT